MQQAAAGVRDQFAAHQRRCVFGSFAHGGRFTRQSRRRSKISARPQNLAAIIANQRIRDAAAALGQQHLCCIQVERCPRHVSAADLRKREIRSRLQLRARRGHGPLWRELVQQRQCARKIVVQQQQIGHRHVDGQAHAGVVDLAKQAGISSPSHQLAHGNLFSMRRGHVQDGVEVFAQRFLVAHFRQCHVSFLLPLHVHAVLAGN